jgi:hypothetical protein
VEKRPAKAGRFSFKTSRASGFSARYQLNASVFLQVAIEAFLIETLFCPHP